MMHSTHYHRSAEVTVGHGIVTVDHPSGEIVVASIVHSEQDADGRVVYALLDRVVHRPHTNYLGWVMSGCFATEMHRAGEARSEHASEIVRRPVAALLDRVWPDAATYSAAYAITEHIEKQDRIVGFWSRKVLLEETVDWIIRRLDSAGLDGDGDQLESVARELMDACKEALTSQ